LQLIWQLFGITPQDPKGVVEADEAGVAADLADGSEDCNGAELFEDVRVAEQIICK